MKPEARIEKAVCAYARAKGCLVYKFVSPSQRGVPDRIFFFGGQTLLIEFKAPGCQPTPLQLHCLGLLSGQGIPARWISNLIVGKDLIDQFVNGDLHA